MSDIALRRFAIDVREAADRLLSALGAPESGGEVHDAPDELVPPDALRAELMRLVPGATQKAVLGLAGLYTAGGMTTEDVRRGIAVTEVAQAFQTLQRLRARDLVEEVPDARPKHWRVAERYRRRLETAAR